MFLSSYLVRRGRFFNRCLHVGGKCLSNPNSEDIVFKSICVNLKHKRWNYLEPILSNLTNSLVSRVVCEFRSSPQLVLDLYKRAVDKNSALDSLDSSCTVVHMLVDSRRFDDALSLMGNLMSVKGKSPLEVLDALVNCYEMCDSSPAVFDALVRACTQIGAEEGAYEVIKKLQMLGFSVSIHAWNNFLSHLLKLNEICRFWKLYKEMVTYGYVENIYTFNLVIYALCKESRIQEAMSVFYRSLKDGIWPNIVTFNMMIDGACKMGDMNLALKLFRKVEMISEEWVKPNSVTYNCLINGFCKIGGITLAEEVRNEMVKIDIEPNIRTYATLIDGYSRVGNLEEGLRLYEEMVEMGLIPNAAIYKSIIHGLSRERDLEGASLLSSDMIDNRVQSDHVTHSIITKCIFGYDCVTDAANFNDHRSEKNLAIDANLCRSNNSAVVKQLLAWMLVRGLPSDVATFDTLIDGNCREGNSKSSNRVYHKMVKTEKNPNLLIYNSIINGFCKTGSVDGARRLVDSLQHLGLVDVITYNTLINGYCKSGRTDEALALSVEMKKVGISADSVTYSTLIDGLCKLGRAEQAKKLMKEMILQGIVPDAVTCTTLFASAEESLVHFFLKQSSRYSSQIIYCQESLEGIHPLKF